MKIKFLWLSLSMIGLIIFTTTASSLAQQLTVEKLAKKWKLTHYKYFFFSEEPAEKEKDDYLYLKMDMTFESISEGTYETGTWKLDAAQNRIYLSNQHETESLVLIIDEYGEHELVLIIDDPTDSDTKDLKIHFKN